MAGVQVGLNSLYYAVLTSDTPLGATYNSPVAIAGAINERQNKSQEQHGNPVLRRRA